MDFPGNAHSSGESGDTEALVFEASEPVATILFSAGRGGSPLRHLPLLEALAERGCNVIAPHFEMIPPSPPAKPALEQRLNRLHSALSRNPDPRLPLAGIGHSIGATLLLTLAGATAWTITRENVSTDRIVRFDSLVLFAPPTDFFRGPGALDNLSGNRIQTWVGSEDKVTPPAQAEFLKDAMAGTNSVETILVEGAGHFSFMNELPPGITDPLPDREAFLASLSNRLTSLIFRY